MNNTYTLNVKEDYEKKTKIADEELNYDKIQNFINNYEYKTTYINIDSRFRNINPQNVVEMIPSYLPSNPITTFKDEYRVQIKINSLINNNSLSVGDKIVLQNIIKNPIILNNSIYLISNYNYYMVNMNNHKIKYEYSITDNYKVNVDNYESLSLEDRLIGNIPINSILGLHSINIYNNDEIFLPNVIKNRIFEELNINETQLIENYFFIKLPFN